jgi:hypothetical protein
VSMRNGLRSPSGCLFLNAPGRFARPVDACFFTLPVGSPLATEMARDADVLGALVGALEDGSCLGSVPTRVVMMSRCCTRHVLRVSWCGAVRWVPPIGRTKCVA